MPETRCDLCGPYTPEQAALLILGQSPELPRTGYLCDRCRPVVAVMARELADEIDRRAVEAYFSQSCR